MQHIANMGNADTMAFRCVSLPEYVIMEAMPDSLVSSLDTMGIKSATLGLVDPIGSPR